MGKNDLKSVLSTLGIVITLVSYVPYFRDMFSGRIRPNSVTWFIWGLLFTIAFFAQVVGGGGLGVMVLGIAALADFTIAGFAFFYSTNQRTKFDLPCLILALLAILLWKLTSNPLYAVILVCVTVYIGYVPTYIKSFYYPHRETLVTFVLSIVKFAISLVILGNVSWVTALVPISVIVADTGFVSMTLWRRYIIKNYVNT